MDSVKIADRKLIVPSSTPRISGEHTTINVTEEFANGEVGFEIDGTLKVNEPEDGPLVVGLELERQGEQ